MEFNWTAMVYIVSCWLIIAEGWTLISTEFMFVLFFKVHISTSIWQLTWSSSSTFLQILTAPCVTNTHNTSLSIAICFPVCTWFDWMILNKEMNVASEFECLIVTHKKIENRNGDKFFYHEGEALWAFSFFLYSNWKRWSPGKNCLQHSKTVD